MRIRNLFKIYIIISLAGIICDAEGGSRNSPSSLMDNDKQSEIVFKVLDSEPLRLNDGYELAVKSVDIDGNKVYLELSKDGRVVDSKVIIPSNEADDTFFCFGPGGAQILLVHFQNAFRGREQTMVTIDRVQQNSETNLSLLSEIDSHWLIVAAGIPLKLEEGYELIVNSVDIDGNKAYVELFKDGQKIDSKVIEPANEENGSFIYSSPGMPQTIMVHFKNYFRGVDQNLATVDNIWQTSEVDSSRILLNDTHSQIIASDMPLNLEEGYKLAIKSMDIDGNKVYVELQKDGNVLDCQVIIAANEVDDTFVYSKPGNAQKIVVHFKNAFRGADQNLATIDSILQ